MTENNLYMNCLSNVTLSGSIQVYQKLLKDAIALLYSPQHCYFAKVDDSGNLMIPNPNPNSPNQEIELDLDYKKKCIFEAKIFNKNHELRWLNDYEGRGKAVLLFDSSLSNNLELEKNLSLSLEQDNQSSEKIKFLDTIIQQYLIWGERIHEQSLENWVTVSTARIGKLNIPLNQELHKNQRIYLKTKEYLAEIDDFGNVSVIEERLVNLEVQ